VQVKSGWTDVKAGWEAANDAADRAHAKLRNTPRKTAEGIAALVAYCASVAEDQLENTLTSEGGRVLAIIAKAAERLATR